VHLFYLVGFQNRLVVLIRWSISFATRGRGARLITDPADADAPQPRSTLSAIGR
jgi:NADH:ubiquinone reductase (H+-translocating)